MDFWPWRWKQLLIILLQLDYEHFQSRVDSSLKKTKRSDRDNTILAKAEVELAKAKEVRIYSNITRGPADSYRNTTLLMRTCDNTCHRSLPQYSLCYRTFLHFKLSFKTRCSAITIPFSIHMPRKRSSSRRHHRWRM